jgi:protein TonB
VQPRGSPSRIRIARDHKPPAITIKQYQHHYRVAYAEPSYPAEANGIEGEVTLDAVIGKDGRVETLSVRSGDPVLARAVFAAVRHWAYRPLKINGVPVEVATEIDVSVRRS